MSDRVEQLLEEVREEHRLNRAAYEEQVKLMLTVIDRNARAFEGLMASLDRFDRRIDAFGGQIEAFGERIDAFGATLEIQREILLRFLDRLDEDERPPQG
jgi:hypothetical protein